MKRNNGNGRYYLTGPRADSRTGASSNEMLSLALTFATRDYDAGIETTYYVREIGSEDIVGYVETREGEPGTDRSAAVEVHRVKPDERGV